jgi:IS605 OrfB family transposase
MSTSVKTLKLRIKDKHASVLLAMAKEVNEVWYFCNSTSIKAVQDKGKWLSGYDLQKLTAGYTKCEGVKIGSSTVQQVCEEYATRRRQFKKLKLRNRASNKKKANYSLGWIPFKASAIKYQSGQVRFAGQKLGIWDSYGLSDFKLRGGSFAEDSRGRWYINICVEVEGAKSEGKAAVGIDLGLKECATTSTGDSIEGRFYRKLEDKLAIAQRAKKKDRTKAIHAKIKNQRKDMLHKFSTKIVSQNAAIFVGNVSSKKLVKTKMAKSTLDAGWAMFKTMLEYKCNSAGVVFDEVNEAYTTQTCSSCGVIPDSSPKGRAGLNERVWTCSSCGTEHHRDVNAAINIRERGLALLAEGIPAL